MRISPRGWYPYVASTMALAVALGGTAYAAVTITGKDIKNGSVTGRDIKNGSLTGKDVRKSSLLAGPRGPRGARGPAGPFPTVNLPSKVTLRGVYGIVFRASGVAPDAAVPSRDSESFAFPLASAPTPKYVASGTEPTAACPGSVADPEAAPGVLCLYEETSYNTSPIFVDPLTNNSGVVSRFGFVLQADAQTNDITGVIGTWAVTAP